MPKDNVFSSCYTVTDSEPRIARNGHPYTRLILENAFFYQLQIVLCRKQFLLCILKCNSQRLELGLGHHALVQQGFLPIEIELRILYGQGGNSHAVLRIVQTHHIGYYLHLGHHIALFHHLAFHHKNLFNNA